MGSLSYFVENKAVAAATGNPETITVTIAPIPLMPRTTKTVNTKAGIKISLRNKQIYVSIFPKISVTLSSDKIDPMINIDNGVVTEPAISIGFNKKTGIFIENAYKTKPKVTESMPGFKMDFFILDKFKLLQNSMSP